MQAHDKSPTTSHRHNRKENRPGFVLVMVLVLIALAGITLAGLARRSLQMTRQVAEARERLQRQWGLASCQKMLLERAENLFEARVADVKPEELIWPLPGQLAGTITLGGLQFELLLADEDAKVNLNTVYRRAPDEVQRTVSLLAGPNGRGQLATNVRLPTSKSLDRQLAPLQSWGQIFEPHRSADPQKIPAAMRAQTAQLTCWGSGKLNVRRASDRAIRIVCRRDVSQDAVNQLLAMRAEPGQTGLTDLNTRMAVENKDQTALRRLITEESRCHSLWITCRSHRRSWSTLIIQHPGDGSGAEQIVFTW